MKKFHSDKFKISLFFINAYCALFAVSLCISGLVIYSPIPLGIDVISVGLREWIFEEDRPKGVMFIIAGFGMSIPSIIFIFFPACYQVAARILNFLQLFFMILSILLVIHPGDGAEGEMNE